MTPVRRAVIQAGLIGVSGDPATDFRIGPPRISTNEVVSPSEKRGEERLDRPDGVRGGVPEGDAQQYPWEDIEEARHNRRLQRQHKPDEAACYREKARPCPKCGRTSKDLAWFYFESPEWTWANLCGRAGWMTVCDACHAQVDCFLESMS